MMRRFSKAASLACCKVTSGNGPSPTSVRLPPMVTLWMKALDPLGLTTRASP